ncbi:Large polyvalent protein-associated domain-containing protein [Escherichia coli]|uniref:LPD38 domain-containing protein n=2 Tax=Escherichia coli TaxID=562 RepID=UPI00198B575D|nr:hypothetical protein [Escherichia coli]
MAYSDEQRPEAQFGNQNRNSLNIQQPGETDRYDAFFSDPNRWKDNSTSFSLGDVLPTMGKGVAQSVRGAGEMARGLGDAMIQSPVKTGARILNEFSRMGLPGVATVQDIFVGGSKGADEVIDTLPDGKNAVTDIVGKGLKVTGKAVSGGAKASDEWLTGKMSPGAQRALNTPMTEGYDDSAVWVAKGVNLIGALVPDMVAGGVTKKLGEVTLRKVLTAGLEKKYIAAGMQPERATALAAEAVDKKMPDLFQAGLITHSSASAQGQSAMAAADSVLNADYSELAKSPKFQQTFLSIDADPQHAQLTDRQKMDLAKERVADEVRAQLATDPELLAVNAMAAKLGDAQLLNLAMRGTAKTVKSGIVRNATEQGTINAAQGGYSRYQENTALRETAGMDVSPGEGVADATIEGAALGAAMGAPFGAVAGYRGRRHAAEETAMREAESVPQDESAPQPEPVDPVAQHRESMQGMNREQLLEQYADADMAQEGDASAVHRREAASQLLNELDEQAKRQAVMDELKAKPRPELLEEYRKLSLKEGRTETEEQQLQAIRDVLRPQQEARPEAQPENTDDGDGSIYPTVRFRDPDEVRIEINGSGASRPAERIEKVRPDNRYFTDEKSAMGSDVFRNASATGLKPSVVKKGENQYAVEMDNPAFSEDVATETINTLADGERIADADPMEQPAFMRDPRFRGFTGDDTEVQARLARGNVPTAEELVRSQMAEGDAGPTAQELTERPRLPAPGDIHPGQGYPLPGEVARTPDENQAGRGGRFTTTGEVKGQSFQKGRAQAPENAAGRRGEILEGEPVRRGLPSPDEQNATAPVREGLPAPESQRGVDMPQPESLPRMVRDSLPELAQQAEARRQTGDNRQTITDVPDTEVPMPVDKPSTHQQARGAKIEDFGEEIKGAAKHRYAQLAETLGKTLEDRDYVTQPLSKLFPKPDYAKLANEGADADTLAMIALYRSDIPAKTKLNAVKWVESVKSIRTSVAGMLEGKVTAGRLAEWMEGRMPARYADTWQLLRTLPPSQIDKASAYRVVSGVYQAAGGKRYDPPRKLYSLRNKDNKGSNLFFSESRDELLTKAKAWFAEQEEKSQAKGDEKTAPSPDDKISFDVYRNTRSGDIFIAYGKNKMRVRGGFKSASDARKYIDSHRDELVRHVKEMREISREEQRNATNRDRTGPERRKGDVLPKQFSDAFGFRGVQFGNYVEGPRRQADLNRAYDSLHDLAEVLNVPTKALSLNGRLGLAFGARGKGKAAAHYEPGEVAINLTKGNGPGALAHEWFHSLDNYFGRYDVSTDGKITSGGDFMTEARRVKRVFKDGRFVDAEYPVRQEVYDAFKGVIEAIKNSDMPRRSALLDEVRSKPYWSTDVEMAARAFERYVQDKARTAGVENDYLVNIRKAPEHNTDNTWAYPTNAELDGGIREAFDHLFRTLKTRETDKGVAFYSRKGVTRTPEGNLISDVNRSAEAKGSPVPQVEAVARGVISGIKDSDLKVRVVKSQKEAEALAGESFDGYGKVHAFYRPDKREIVLVADNIPDGRTVREKLRHEIIHHAMEHVVTPAEYQTIIKTVLKTRDSDNATIREAWRKVDASYGKESPEVQAGEFLAHMAEKQPNKFVAAWERVVALVKGVLRRTGLLKPTELNDIRLVRETIRTLGQRVREGYTPREDGAGASSQYSRSGKPDPFKADAYDAKQFASEVRRIAGLQSVSRREMLRVGDTPRVLRALGAPDLELVMPASVVHKATRPEIREHFVSVETLADLPQLLTDPVAVMRSKTESDALVSLIQATDTKGNPVIVAIHTHVKGDGFAEINKIASAYGKDKRSALQDQLDTSLLYLNKEKAAEWLHAVGLQLPEANTINGSSGFKILHPEDIRKGPYYSRTSSLTPEETIASRFVRQMQDKFQVLKAVQENIRKTGGKVDDSNNAYMAEELFHGKAENDLNVMKERYVQPLAKLLADYKIAQADLDEYLYARHAPERNAHIAKINPKMPDGGSGMTNAEAAEIMQRVRNSGKQAQYDRLAGIIDDMLARRREIIREAGLEESGVVDAWQKAYRYYVPLKGQDVDGVVSLPRTGKGFTIGGRESKQAMGRASRAQSPSTQAIQDLSESLIRNRKNEVGNAFLKLVQDNPDKDYWQVFTNERPDTMRAIAERVDPETGETRREVVERPVPMAMMADRYFTTKKDGKTYYIKLHDPRLMRAMKNMGPETSNAVIRTLGKVNRFLATVNTSYNPEFLVSNFIRDVQTAVMNLKAEQGRSDGKLKGLDNLSALAVVKDSRSAMSAVYASLRGKTLTGKGAQWQKVWKEFVEDGGKTGWFNMGDLEGQQKEMDRLVSLAKGGWKGQSIGAWHSFLNLVEDANGAVENALRLSAYKHARDAGLSRQQAASLAKNMTVNFNRRGEQGALMNSLYMFANASIQGTANLVRTLGHLNGDGPLLERLRWKNLNVPQKIALAAVGAGYLLGSLNRSVAGEDDDGVNWYDKVPYHVKERNLVIMKSMFGGRAGEYWSIPLPYGYNVFFLLGHTSEGVAAGDLTASRAAGNVVGGILGAFSPIGSETSETLSGALLKNAAPTILRPFANLAMNENFMGAQIYQENMPFGTPKPDSQLGRRSTPEAYKAFASWLNAFSGGSQYRPGAVDITPESLKFWIDYISGGTGRFISKTTDAAVKSLNGIDIPEQQVPFLGKISGEVMPYADQQKMYDRMTEVAQYHAELKSLTGAERTAFIDENNGKLLMNGLMQDTRKRLKDLRKQRDAIYADSSLSLAQQAAMVKSVERDMKVAVDRFNREYNKKVGVD